MKNSKTLSAILFISIIAFACKKENKIDTTTKPSGTISCEIISTDITTTRTLTNRVADSSMPDYCITNYIHITNGAGLIIEPGVVIHFSNDAGIEVGKNHTGRTNGYLKATGTFSQRIVFTGESKTPGFWRGILFSDKSPDPRNELDFCIVEYAGSSAPSAVVPKAAVSTEEIITGGVVNINNTIIRNNNCIGFFSHYNGSVKSFTQNRFLNNSDDAIRMSVEEFHIIDKNTTFSGNGYDGIVQKRASFGTEQYDETGNYTWENVNGNYFLTRGMRLDNNALTLTIKELVTVEMEDSKEIYVEKGTFKAIGLDRYSKARIKGKNAGTNSWKGILFESSSINNEISFTNITEAGSAKFRTAHSNPAGVVVEDFVGTGRVNINNSIIANSGGCGIYTHGSGVLYQTSNLFLSNVGNNTCN